MSTRVCEHAILEQGSMLDVRGQRSLPRVVRPARGSESLPEVQRKGFRLCTDEVSAGRGRRIFDSEMFAVPPGVKQ